MKLLRIVAVAILVNCSGIAHSASPYNYSALWLAWGETAQGAYIDGVVDATGRAFFTTLNAVAPDKALPPKFSDDPEVHKVIDQLFVRDTSSLLQGVMTDLYKDPANSFIDTLDVFFLARDKIEGRDISKDIVEARRKAIVVHKFNKKMQQ